MADNTLSSRMRRGECNAHELALVAKVYDAAVAETEAENALLAASMDTSLNPNNLDYLKLLRQEKHAHRRAAVDKAEAQKGEGDG